MKTKKLTFLPALTFLFLFSGSVYGEESDLETSWDNARGIWTCKHIYRTLIRNGNDVSQEILQKDSELTFIQIKGDTISFSDKSGKWVNPHAISWDVSELTASSKTFIFNLNFRKKNFAMIWTTNFIHPQIYSSMGTCEKIENQFKYFSPN
jgi:hypothetical protein